MTAYHRKLEHARRDVRELDMLLAVDAELTELRLAQAIGLASGAHDALLRAMVARYPMPDNAG